MVTDREDSKHGEISVLEDAATAERLLETLLEAGFEPSRIRVFSGRNSEFEISHRPVVALVGDEEIAGQALEGTASVSFAEEPAPRRADEPPAAAAVEAEEPVEADERPVEGAVAATAEAGEPVKFSSLFRSA
jgi:hypothetical protein